ncbi:hypothetical protein HMPREF0262_00700 [Clostridium sp. ATCC 29733]|nr:hypothetical protein HMPREF0262_00700 [Clostridium sp. ATCC 29733]
MAGSAVLLTEGKGPLKASFGRRGQQGQPPPLNAAWIARRKDRDSLPP